MFDAGLLAGFEDLFGGAPVVAADGGDFAAGAAAPGGLGQMDDGVDLVAAEEVGDGTGDIVEVDGGVVQGPRRGFFVEGDQFAAAGDGLELLQEPGADVAGGSGDSDNFAGFEHQE